ncbi:long-chain-fatty-acid--CoA ligase [Nocardioides sp. KR10-350]|uniref:long-chain-fatty-acid--CoA ligase n=1 Tax=Nocardioides cheoyonin TaxID=3156615 RepID=UPI0032B38692
MSAGQAYEERTAPELSVHGQGQTLSAQVGRHARSAPRARALTFVGAQRPDTTYAELHDRAGRLATVLADRGVRAGERVALLMTNRPQYAEALVACSRLGAIAVPLSFRLVPAELTYQLADSGACALLVDTGLLANATEALPGTAVTATLVTDTDDYEAELAAAGPHPEIPVDEDTAAVILYTSGTTGRPKGAMLSHRNLHSWVASRYAHMGFPSSCRVSLCAVPMFHVAGYATYLSTMFTGGRMVLMPSGAFDAAEVIDVLDREQVSLAFFVPAQWQAIVRHPALAGRSFPHFVAANWGAAPASAQLVREIRAAFPTVSLTSAFGQTETCSSALVLMPEDAAERPDSVGKPMLGVEARVVDPEMNDVPPGEVGEIVYRGPTVMTGYWNAPEKTAEAFRGGWFHSGDLVRVDEDGFYYVVDRIKDMIISGGENVYCAEVENVLAGHPKVGSVAVVGAPHARWGEVPVAVVVPRGDEAPTAEELEAYGRRFLAGYKVPKRITVVPAMPMNASGKILKGELRSLVRSGA